MKSDFGLFCFQNLHVDSEKVWPNIPPPVPVCNGCGVTGVSSDSLLGVHLSKTPQKYGLYTQEAHIVLVSAVVSALRLVALAVRKL